MMVKSKKILLNSQGNFHSINITEQVSDFVKSSGIKNGVAIVFYQHTTGVVMIYEQEAGVMVDLEDAMDRIFPDNKVFQHHLREVDDNGGSHVRSAFLNTSLTVPVIDGDLALGKYQEIVIVDLQAKSKQRSLILQVMGE
jgi:secondary thiamine-phosphate synthase enzyme